MSFYAKYPISGGGGGVSTYANLAAFPSAATAGNGALAIALDTDILYISNGTAWEAIGGPGAILSLGAFGSTPNADGASIIANALVLQPADGTHPGGVSTSAQTFAGDKTFSGNIIGQSVVSAATQLQTPSIGMLSGAPVIDISNFLLKDNNGYSSVAWNLSQLKDLSNVLSVDWNSRILYDSSGNPAFNWNSGGIIIPSLTAGSVVFAGASGVLSQDNNNFFWDNTNKRLGLGQGGATPSAALDVHQSGITVPQIQANNTGTQSSSGGALVQVLADPGAAILSGSRLGAFQFAGSTDASHTSYTGAAIAALATENWSGTAGGSKLNFNVTANTTHVRSTALTIDQDASATFSTSVSALSHIFRGSSSGAITIGGGTSPTSYSLVLPSAQGAASTVLTNDGAGNLSWAPASSGAGLTTPTTSSTYGNTTASGSMTGTANTAIGISSMGNITSGSSNTALGYLTGNAISTGSNNVSIGRQANSSVTTGGNNISIGFATNSNNTGSDNISIGNAAGSGYNTGTGTNSNTAIGSQAGNGSGGSNVARNVHVGFIAGASDGSGSSNVVIGASANARGSNHQIVIGDTANTFAADSIAVGYRASAGNTAGPAFALGTGIQVGNKSIGFGGMNNPSFTTSVDSADGQISFGTTDNALKDMYLGRGAVTVASPVAASIRPTGASGTDVAGANLTILAGNGTGAGGSGSIIFQTAPVAASSSSANTYATALTIKSNSISQFSGGVDVSTVVFTSAGNYAAGAPDQVVVINKSVGAATQVTLPASPDTGRLMTVKDGKGDAATNNITIVAASGNIDGAGSYLIATNYGFASFVYNGSQWNRIG